MDITGIQNINYTVFEDDNDVNSKDRSGNNQFDCLL